MRTTFLLVTAAAAVLAVGAAPAAAKGKRDRVRERVSLTESGAVGWRQARLQIERKGLDRQELRLQIEGAPSGLDLEVWMADATGALVRVAGMREEGSSGEYKWRVRTRKGDALPFGVADLAELSGRAIEVRSADGALVATATFPTVDTASTASRSGSRKSGKLLSSLAVDDGAAAALGGDDTLTGKIKVKRKRGEEELEIEVEHAPSGLLLDAWIGDGAGGFAWIGALTEQADDDGAEYELEIESEDGGALPLGAASLADLAGRTVEIRTQDGTVLASGTIPDLGPADSTGSGDDDDSDDDSSDDDSSDDDGSDDDGPNHD